MSYQTVGGHIWELLPGQEKQPESEGSVPSQSVGKPEKSNQN